MPPKAPKPLATQPTTLNLPPFREEQPAMWFTLAEGQFEIKGMQDRRHWFYTASPPCLHSNRTGWRISPAYHLYQKTPTSR